AGRPSSVARHLSYQNTHLIFLLGTAQALFGTTGLALPVPHLGIETARGKQRPVRSPLGDAAVTQHDDFVRADDRGKPVSDDQRRAVAAHQIESRLDLLLGMGVERR